MVQKLLNAARNRAFGYGFWDGLTCSNHVMWASRPVIVRSFVRSDLRAERLVRRSLEMAAAEMTSNG